MYLYLCIEFMAHVSPLLSPIAVPFRSAYLAATQSKISPDHDAEFSLLLGPLRAFAIVGLGGEETAVGRSLAFSVSATYSPSPVLPSPLCQTYLPVCRSLLMMSKVVCVLRAEGSGVKEGEDSPPLREVLCITTIP